MNQEALNIITGNSYLTLSTINDDGSPWATPLHFVFADGMFYWFSLEDTIHSRNIARDGRVALTIFDSHQGPEVPEERGAVYVTTIAKPLYGDAEMAARDVYADKFTNDTDRKLREGSRIYGAAIGEYDGIKSDGQRLYFAHRGGQSEA